MITKLTQKQIERQGKISDYWIKLALYSGDKINEKDAKEGIYWLYSQFQEKKPEVLFVDNPLGIQFAMNMLSVDNSVYNFVYNSVYNSVKNSVWNSVKNSVLNSVKNSVWNSVKNSVWNSVLNSVDNSVRNSVDNSVWNSVLNSVDNSVDNSVGDSVGDSVGNSVENSADNSVLNSVLNSVRNSVGDYVWDSVRNSVGKSVLNSVENSVGNSVYNSVRNSVDNSVRNSVRDNKLKYFDFNWQNLSNIGWFAFYDYWYSFNLYDEKTRENFNKYKKFLKSGVFMSSCYENVAVLCRRPLFVRKNNAGQLHCDDRPAIGWRDGYELYFLDGVELSKEMWEKITQKKLSYKEIMELSNIEQRMIALKYMDSSEMLKSVNAKLLDKSENGNELYLVEKLFDGFDKAYFLRYSCPSTGRVYLSGIDPEFAEKNINADVCMGWKFRLSIEDYLNMSVQT